MENRLITDELMELGWNEAREAEFLALEVEELIPGRVAIEHRGMAFVVMTEHGNVTAKVPGRLIHEAEGRAGLPVVGDWVALQRTGPEDAIVHALLSRTSKFSRKVAHQTTEEQVLVANIDFVFIVSSLNAEMNLRRLERYLTLGWESGATPVVVLTKSDLAEDVDGALAAATAVAPGVSIHAISAVEGDGVDELLPYFRPARTVALLGSSGAGKSTLTNALMGEEIQKVQAIRSDDKGRHTTTNRELILIPGGGIVIDTPGMRELQLWDAGEGISGTFQDIEDLAAECRFRDCRHLGDAGCAVQAAVEAGTLPAARLESYHKLQRELIHLAHRQDQRAASDAKRKWKVMSKAMRGASPKK
jgi:ribosome biogenesis GTPase